MELDVHFKIPEPWQNEQNNLYCIGLLVECDIDTDGTYIFLVDGVCYNPSYKQREEISIQKFFQLDEAFEFIAFIRNKYPKNYSAFKIDKAPVFDERIIKEPRPSSATE